MDIARINVMQNRIEVKALTPVTQGLVGAAVIFEGFGPEWEGLKKTAVFQSELYGNTETRDVICMTPGEPVRIPREVLQQAEAELKVGVCGSSGDGRICIPTVYGSLGRIQPAARPVDRPTEEPSPSWADQIESRVNEAVTKSDAVGPLCLRSEEAAAAAADSAGQSRQCAREVTQKFHQTEEYALQTEQYKNEVSRGTQDSRQYWENTRKAAEESRAGADRAKREADRAEALVSGLEGAVAETDPTVPAWAKNPEKPRYTPEEIGAQPAGSYALSSQIPVRLSQLANDREFTDRSLGLRQVKPGDLIRAGAVDAEGKITQWESVSPMEAESKFELIDTVTVDAQTLIRLSKGPDGTPYRFTALRIVGTLEEGTGAWSLCAGLSMAYNDMLANLYIDYKYTRGFILDVYENGGYWDSTAYRSSNEYVMPSQKNLKECFAHSYDGRPIANIYSVGPVTSRVTLKIFGKRCI